MLQVFDEIDMFDLSFVRKRMKRERASRCGAFQTCTVKTELLMSATSKGMSASLNCMEG